MFFNWIEAYPGGAGEKFWRAAGRSVLVHFREKSSAYEELNFDLEKFAYVLEYQITPGVGPRRPDECTSAKVRVGQMNILDGQLNLSQVRDTAQFWEKICAILLLTFLEKNVIMGGDV